MGSSDSKLLAGAKDCNLDQVISALQGGANVDAAEPIEKEAVRSIPWQIKGTFPTTNRQTALIYAASQGQAHIVKALLEHKARCDVCDKYGWTPLHHACHKDYFDCVALLLEASAATVHACDHRGRTPLHYAASKSSNGASIKLLIETGKANVNAQDADGYTPLINALGQFDQRIGAKFLDLCIPMSAVKDTTNSADQHRILDANLSSLETSPLDAAFYSKHDRLVTRLIEEFGADPSKQKS